MKPASCILFAIAAAMIGFGFLVTVGAIGNLINENQQESLIGFVIMLVVMGIGPILVGIGIIWFTIRHNRRAKIEVEERKLLEMARHHGGRLTVALVAMHTTKNSAEAKALLDRCHAEGLAQIQINPAGEMEYLFSGLSLTFENKSSGWEKTAYRLENGVKKVLPLTVEASAEIDKLIPEFNADFESFLNDLPTDPVALGATWSVVEAEVAAGLGNALQGLFSEGQVNLLEGDDYRMTMSLDAVQDDALVFGLSGRVAVHGVSPEREMTVTFDLRDSQIVVRRGAYMVRSFAVNGAVSMEGFTTEAGKRIQLMGKGKLTFAEASYR